MRSEIHKGLFYVRKEASIYLIWMCTQLWVFQGIPFHVAYGMVNLYRNSQKNEKKVYSAVDMVAFSLTNNTLIIIYCWVTAQSTAQGHLRAFHNFKFRIQVEYNTKHAHYTNVKHTNIIQKVAPSVSLW